MKLLIPITVCLLIGAWYTAHVEDESKMLYLKENCINDYILNSIWDTCYMKIGSWIFQARNKYNFERIEETKEIYNKLDKLD